MGGGGRIVAVCYRDFHLDGGIAYGFIEVRKTEN